MKLLFVVPEYGSDVGGGIATFYHHLIPGLVKAGCKVDICVSDSDRGKQDTDPGNCEIFSAAGASLGQATKRLSHLAAVPEVQRALATAFATWDACNRGAGYDIVEVTDWRMLYAPWLSAPHEAKVNVQLHGSNGQVDFYDPFNGAEFAGLMCRVLESALLARADELQTTGPKNAESWASLLCRPVYHIWPAWPEKQPTARQSATQVRSYGVVVGRVQSWKGPDVLCRALALLGPLAPEIRWVGRDHPYGHLDQSLSVHLQNTYPEVWGKSVKPVGQLSREKTFEAQAAAKFVVVPSTWDVCNQTAIEAMGVGKVVICSEGAGAAALIEHGVNGFRFPTGDAERLAELIGKVDALPVSVRQRIGREASETIKHELSLDRIVALRLERFAKLAASPPCKQTLHPWLEGFFSSSAKSQPFGFLGSLPLREIVRHAARRVASRSFGMR